MVLIVEAYMRETALGLIPYISLIQERRQERKFRMRTLVVASMAKIEEMDEVERKLSRAKTATPQMANT